MIIQKVGGFRAYWYEVGKVCFSWWFLFFLVLSLSSVFFATTFGGVFVVASFLISLL
ncbi:MAG: hypothetical protein LBG52_00265 [Candidatus Peribacteria bacterium]|jgi:hypothetical protein|nr:hypothetical protein [Candidatus Peribacteria bacterium]